MNLVQLIPETEREYCTSEIKYEYTSVVCWKIPAGYLIEIRYNEEGYNVYFSDKEELFPCKIVVLDGNDKVEEEITGVDYILHRYLGHGLVHRFTEDIETCLKYNPKGVEISD